MHIPAGDQPGVVRANASPTSQSVLVTFDAAVTTAEALLRAGLASAPEEWPPAGAVAKKTAWGYAAQALIVACYFHSRPFLAPSSAVDAGLESWVRPRC